MYLIIGILKALFYCFLIIAIYYGFNRLLGIGLNLPAI